MQDLGLDFSLFVGPRPGSRFGFGSRTRILAEVPEFDLQRAVFYNEKGRVDEPQVSFKFTVRESEPIVSINAKPPISGIFTGLRVGSIREGVANGGDCGIALGNGRKPEIAVGREKPGDPGGPD